ncbi:maleylacetoacetate isomerase [Oceanobacter mangrovi]|uniref:maleylacetoacetate isomerase n=1 Tax=Oceanobacter mangrovi TaxID=2862510 RepID=UPI001C8D623F|nr:maleylacetoacetate isomerase [Oceanobacter mangrovi]
MQLYSFFNSSTSYRVRIALALKGLAYDYHGVNIRVGEQREPEYVAKNPGKGVPLLVENDGTMISQSMAIISYLDERYPEPRLIPTDLIEKTRVLEIANLIACDMHPVNNLRILGYLTKRLGVSDEDKSGWYNHWIKEGFDAVEALLERYGHGRCCFGDEPTLADVCLVPQVGNALRFGCDLSGYPRLMAIYEYCLTLPAFEQAAPANQPDLIK